MSALIGGTFDVRPSTGLGSCVFRAWLTPYLSPVLHLLSIWFPYSPKPIVPQSQHLCPSWPQRPNILMQIILTSPAGCADPRTPHVGECAGQSWAHRGICKYHPPVFPWMEIALSLLQMSTKWYLVLFCSFSPMSSCIGFCFWIFN